MLNNNQKGVSLIEVLIGLAVGIVLTFGMVVFYSNISKVSNETLTTVRLEHELQTSMNMMKNDIRRAGYSSEAAALVGTGIINPFMVVNVSDIRVINNTCILFTYELNNKITDYKGKLPPLNSAGSDNRFGYRLSNKTLQTRAATDAKFACNEGTWEDLTNPKLIQITKLNFNLSETAVPLDTATPSGPSITIRQVTIEITGQLVSDNDIERTITSQVRVRNDKYTP